MSGNQAPGFAKDPGHRIDIRPAGVRVRIVFRGEVIADSLDALRLEESGYKPVFYVPRTDVKMERLQRTAHASYCPYKGHASYFTLATGEGSSENAAWSYEAPYEEMDAIRGRLAFYPSRVDRIEASPA